MLTSLFSFFYVTEDEPLNTTRYGFKLWRYAAAKHWNSRNTLPRDIRSMAGSKNFLEKIRQTDFLV